MKTNNEAKYRNNKYFYPLVPQLIDAMQRALIEFEAKSTVRQITNASFFPELSKFLFHQQQKIQLPKVLMLLTCESNISDNVCKVSSF